MNYWCLTPHSTIYQLFHSPGNENLNLLVQIKFLNLFVYTETCQKYPVTVIFYYIFHIKPQFFKALFQSQFLFDFDESLTKMYVVFCDYFKIFFGSTDFKYS
jgi:hypothetical protein